MSFQKGLQKEVISKVFTYKLIIDQVNECRQCIHDYLLVSFDYLFDETEMFGQNACTVLLCCLTITRRRCEIIPGIMRL